MQGEQGRVRLRSPITGRGTRGDTDHHSARGAGGAMSTVEETIVVAVPVGTAYNQWTQFKSFPRFMAVVKGVEQIRPNLTRWVIGLGPVRHEFDAEIVDQRPDSLVRWRSLGPRLAHRGEVSFRATEADRTEVSVRIDLRSHGAADPRTHAGSYVVRCGPNSVTSRSSSRAWDARAGPGAEPSATATSGPWGRSRPGAGSLTGPSADRPSVGEHESERARPMKKAPREEPDERLTVTPPKTWATGVPAVTHALEYSLAETSVRRTGLTLLTMNQVGGIDCPGCAWADPAPGHRHVNEYCENGAKHINDEATSRRVTADFFRMHTVSGLGRRSDLWLNQQGRLTEPMVKRPGADHYEPISWHDALGLLADELRSLDSPDEAVFYTSGRVSNEAAFLLQLFARAFGTNNLPDCSNMCHESSGFALHETLGTGKGTVSLDDLHHADLILVVGQNPGTNHPRQLSALEEAKRNGARVIAVNALPEAGLLRFRNPQKARGIIGRGVPIADQFLQIRSGGDLALFQGLNRLLLEAEDARPGTVLDQDFIRSDTSGFEEFSRHARTVAWEDVLVATGLTRGEIEKVRDEVLRSERVVVCWAMGVTQHRHGVPTILEIVNFLLLRGNLGKAGAGACPVRGHSNVQGDRTMGVWEQMPDSFLDALREEFGFEPPRAHGFDSVNAIRAMGEGRVKVFVSVPGNFVRAAPDSDVTEDAMRRCRLTVHVSTKLNRSHTVCGETALILPTLGRTERD